jgi:hypothetical protein
MVKKQLFACLLLCLSVVVSVHPGLAQDKRQSKDPIAQLLRDGWRIVQDGVLQRDRGAHQVETYVFGEPGFIWKLQDLQSQLHNLRVAYQADPNPDLRKAILNHRQEIANTQKLIALAHAAELNGDVPPPPGKVSCSINFSYNANAAALTTSQGVTATASATFSGTCGFTGEVYAYSYSTATVSGAATTQTLTDGPRSGASVTASSFTSQTGVTPCTSYGYASMTSSGLSPSSYTISATNSSCPAVVTSPVPHITGPTYVSAIGGGCTTSTWTASATGGTTPYSFSWTWNGTAVGTGTSYSRTVCAGGVATDTFNTLGLGVTDSGSRTGSTSLSVEVYKGGTTGGGTGCVVGGGTLCP